jgi:2-methylfumaryl-CoA isomerase
VDLGQHAERYALRHEIAELVASWVAARPLAEVRKVFDAAGVLWGPYQSYGQMVAEDPRCSTDNPMFRNIDQPGIGPVTTPGTPLAFSGAQRTGFVAPQPGGDTREVLTSILQLGASEVDGLFQRRVAGGA